MNDGLTNSRKLQQFLDDEVVLMRSLDQLLMEEQAVLTDNEAEKLGTITPEKNNVLMQIIELEKNRNLFLTSVGYTPDAKGMQDFFSAPTNDAKIEETWKLLLSISSEAQEKNRTNGLLISRQLSRNQSALNVLQQNNQTGSMYGADGQSKNSPSAGRGIVAG
ncbi:flagella synthesis protein FlgN [Undibacterium sp. Di24W]|uniref:flagella synthesis protein FlgN n=1 Tax=Undibacterium sp. Di24W TaxID=3413033 RepID=UPI003BF008D5